MILVHIGIFLPGHRGIVSTVEKAVFHPRGLRELDPLYMVVQQTACLNVHYVNFAPVRPTARNGVGHVLPVFRKTGARQGHCPVVGQLVRVKEHARLTVQAVLDIKQTLVLKAVVLEEVILSMLLHRHAYFLVIGHVGEAFQQGVAERNPRKVFFRHLVFRFHPSRRSRTSVVFQPSVRVWHFRSEIYIHRIHLSRFRIRKFRLPYSAGNPCQTRHRQHQYIFVHIETYFFNVSSSRRKSSVQPPRPVSLLGQGKQQS